MGQTTAPFQMSRDARTGEFAAVVLGGRPIGFACVEAHSALNSMCLLTHTMYRNPPPFAPDADETAPCTCCSDDLAFAMVRAPRGKDWEMGVKVCVTHGQLRSV